VDMFFILSGLVIVQSLDSFKYRARPFLIARVARIYPVFLVVCALAVVAQPIGTGFERMAWIGPESPARFIWSGGWPSAWGVFVVTHLTMTHGLFPNGVLPDVWVGFLGAAWSLSTEWQFYVLALLVGKRLGLVWMAWLFVFMAGVALLWQAAVPEAWQFSRAFLPNKAQYFALGIASGAVMRRGWSTYWPILVTVMAVCGVQGGVDKLLPPLAWTVCLAAQYANSVAPVGPSRPLCGSRALLGWVAVLLASRPMVWLGAVSYCIYLMNEPVQKLLGVTRSLLVAGDGTLSPCCGFPVLCCCRSSSRRGCTNGSNCRRSAMGDASPCGSERPVERRAAFAQGLRFIARRRPARRAFRGRGRCVEQRLRSHHLMDPGLVRRIIGRDPPFGARLQNACQQGQHRRMDEAPLGVARLGPRVGEQQEQPVQRLVGEGAQQNTGVVGPEAEVLRERGCGLAALRHQTGEQGTDAVDEHLAGDQPNVGICSNLRQRVLAAAEADFQPERSRPPRRVVEKPRQGDFQQPFLARAQAVAAGAAIETLWRRLQRPRAAFRPGTRSVFSHVKVPFSGSGSRPKCP
jgi:peptidoglycan/LPS O-acetylase OafA/YrhL